MLKLSNRFQLVEPSVWPSMVSIIIMSLFFNTILLLNRRELNLEWKLSKPLMYITLLVVIVIIYNWINEIIIEGNYLGLHTEIVKKMLYWGFMLFLLSEILIFGTLFFGYFYTLYFVSVETYNEYLYSGIIPLKAFLLPLLNTLILYGSSLTTFISFNLIKTKTSQKYLLITIILGILFSSLQFIEYKNSFFTLIDGIYGTYFYILTGFHGFHVIVGIILLLVSLIRLTLAQELSIGFLASIYYWYFVDYVWILIYTSLYIASSN